MKRNLFIAACLGILMILTGCGKKEVKILSSTIEGDLKGNFKVLDSVCEVVKDEDGNPSIVVNIERTDESLPFTPETVGCFGEKNDKSLVLAGFGYESYNGEDELVGHLDADENNKFRDQQLEILKLQPGEKGTLTISFDKDVPEGVVLTSELDFLSTGEITMEGAVGKYGIKNFSIDFDFQKRRIIGQYQYKSSPAGAFLYLMGNIVTVDKNQGDYTFKVLIAEDNGLGELSGKFKGELKLVRDTPTSPYYYVLVGNFRNQKLQNFRYDLKSAPIDKLVYGNVLESSYAATMNPMFAHSDFDDYGFGSYSEEAAFNGGSGQGDASIDEMLRAYRQFYKKLINVAKKVKQNDPMAVLEYTELVSEYSAYVSKLESVKGEMSPAQLKEFNKINEELVKEMSQAGI